MPKNQDYIYKCLEKYFPEHLGGYENGWLKVNKYSTKERDISEVYSSEELILRFVEFKLDGRKIRQVFSKNKIKETSILWN